MRPMFLAAPPTTTGRTAATLPFSQVNHHIFGPGRTYTLEGTHIYFADLARLYGLTHGDDYFDGLTRNSFTEMAGEAVAPFTAGDPFDLVIMAHSTPDPEPGWPGPSLTQALPGGPLAFGIAEQGTAATATALRVAAEYAASAGTGRSLVLALEQSVLLHDLPLPDGVVPPARDAVAALVLDPADPAGTVTPRQYADVALRDVPALLGEAHGAGRNAITGQGLDPERDVPADWQAGAAPSGLPATGIWAALARELPALRAGEGGLVLADYDRELRYLHTYEITFGAERPA
ncbi:hypothetical protein [Marinactinospora rubrisoli]|uniref:Uncharacterized protein n=1 Tax=Marinactinospora rubrisoli TaxID=2715399 RepID=A0ABW2KH96_9ACTN